MKEIMIFKNELFGEIRTLTDEQGEPWFVGKDVAAALGYSNTSDALKKHVDKEDKKDKIANRDSIGRTRKVVFINESGMYSLILCSKLPSAKLFKRWVTSVVLPQIRKTGGYIPTVDSRGREFSKKEIVARGLEIIGKTIALRNQYNEDCLTATEVAGRFGMEVLSFNKMLEHMGVQRREHGRWVLNELLQGKGLTEDRLFLFFSLKGDFREQEYLVWTPKGVAFLERSLHLVGVKKITFTQLQMEFGKVA